MNRRRFLVGLGGVCVALPFLDAFRSRKATAGPTTAPRFAIFMRQANGVQQKWDVEPESFWPRNLGALTAATFATDADRAVSELKDYASKLLLVRGVNYPFPENFCGHAAGGAQCLTAQKFSDPPNGQVNRLRALGESIDNRIARELNPPGTEPLTLYSGPKGGYIDEVLSYSASGQLRAAENNPYNAYTRLFGMAGATDATAKALATQRKSVNDYVRGDLKALMGRADLSPSDKVRLDQHFSSIRDLETNIACKLADPAVMSMRDISARVAEDDSRELVAKMQMDIIALTISCGLNRVATLQIGDGNDSTQYMINGVRQPRYHQISHRIFSDGSAGDPIPDAVAKHHEIDKLHGRLFKYLLDKLAAVDIGAGQTLLDAGLAVWLNDLADGPPHGANNLPYVIAGSAGGFLKTGAYVDAGQVTHNKMLNTLGAAVGCKNANAQPLDDFGDPSLAKGLIPQMLA